MPLSGLPVRAYGARHLPAQDAHHVGQRLKPFPKPSDNLLFCR